MKDSEGSRDTKETVNAQKDIMSVCLAVVRGKITPEKARAAILARTSPAPLADMLHLDPTLVRDAEQLARLPEQDREQCLELFKELYDSTPGDKVLEEDGGFGRQLIEQRLVTAAQVEVCSAIQKRLHEAGIAPLPRLGELLIQQGFLMPGQAELAPTRRVAIDARSAERPSDPAPAVVQEALTDPAQRFGRYVRVSLLGQGGAGEVWKAWDSGLERWVALKFLKFEDSEELARLKREAQTAARLSHPNIAAVFEMAEANGRTFLVMEYIDGQTLATYPRNDHRRLVSLMRDVSLAIQYAHDKGVIHRDIKPGNIMVDSAGRPFIMDFGLARHINSDRSLGEYILGTPSYMPPEQARGAGVDARSDVYSLGATLYELLSDRPPFRGKNALDTLDQVVRNEPPPLDRISEDLRTIVTTCLMKEPSRRYASAAQVAEDIRRWQEGEALIAHPPSMLYRFRKKVAKRRAVLGVGLGGLLLAGSVAVGVVPRWRRAMRERSRVEEQLTLEKKSRAGEAHEIEEARPHVEEARKQRTRLDRLLMNEESSAEVVRITLEKIHKELDRALEIHPNYPEALVEKARAFMAAKDRARGLEFYTKAINASSGYTIAYISRARQLLEKFELIRHAGGGSESPELVELGATIRADLKKVIDWSKDSEELSFANGALAILDGDFEKAARIYEEYARASLLDYRGWEWAGHAWLHVPGMQDKAIVDLSEAIKFRPREARLRLYRGKAYLDSARYQLRIGQRDAFAAAQCQAVADFRLAGELDSSLVEAPLGLGDAGLLAGDSNEAMAQFGKAVELSAGSPVPLVARAWARLRLQDREGALADAEEALRRESKDPSARVARGRARLASGDVGGAQADFEETLARYPRHGPAMVGVGDVLRERGETAKAVERYGIALNLDPGLAEAYAHRGNAERELGQEDQAVQDISRALELDPVDPYLRLDLSVCYGNLGNWAAAEAELRAGLRLSPSRPDWFWERLWLARSKRGEPDQALEEFRAWLRERPASIPGKLAPKINSFIAGKLSEGEFVALLERTEYSRSAIAEGYFVAGEKALLEGRTSRAIELLKRCLKTGALTSQGYSTAAVELRGLSQPR
jgi:tetratricopeptide (TPR) repeat protein/predicted Ser/Thr protein kinase